MSVHFISGKPGGGKTLYSVKLIVEELVHGHRTIITNVPLRLDMLNAYLQTHYPAAYERYFEFKSGDCNVAVADDGPKHITDRILLLGEDDLPRFFTYRGLGVRLASVTNDEWREGKRPDFSGVKDGGVLYVLDEVHIAFNSRAWALTGNEVLYYLSQHRKLGDDVVCITQAIGNVDKQFRSVAQDYTYVRNLSKQRAGLFRLPAIFVRSTYGSPATPTTAPMESGTFRLDVSGLAACYDTAKGVGIHGRAGADTGARKKGIHWLWFVVACPVFFWFFLHWLPIIIGHHLAPDVRPALKAHEAVQKDLPPVGSVVVVTQYVQAVASPVISKEATSGQSVLPVTDSPAVYCLGYAGGGGSFTLFLSDGSRVKTSSGRVTKIAEDYVVVDGKKMPVHEAPAVPSPPVPKVEAQRVSPPDLKDELYIPVPVTLQ